jgi:hypothetical protein
MSHNFPNTNLRGFNFIGKDLTEVDFIGMRQWRYSSAVLATLVVALGNISLFLDAALAQGNLKERISDGCSIQNIEQYIAEIDTNLSPELEDKFRKCSWIAVPWLIAKAKVNNADTQFTAISLLAMIGTPASSASPRLIEILQSSQNEDLRILAVGALPKIASSENLKPIIVVLSSTLKDKNQDMRFGSAIALVNLYNKLSFSSNTDNALRQIISKDVVPILIDAFKNDDTRFTAINTLAEMSEYLKSITAVLVSALKDKNQDIDIRVGSALTLAYLYENGDNDTVRSLDQIIRDDIVHVLIDAKNQDKNDALRTVASIALSDIDMYARYGISIVWLHKMLLVDTKNIRRAVLNFANRNQPKGCLNYLASLFVGWKCYKK